MSTKSQNNITPDTNHKLTLEKNYFSYPNGYQSQSRKTNHANHSIIKIKTLNNIKYRSISNSPSVSPDSSNDDTLAQTSLLHKKWYCRVSNLIKILIISILFIILISAAIFNSIVLEYSQHFLDWMNAHPIQGSFAYIFLEIVCSVIMIPGSILTLGAGFVYVKMFGQKGVILASIVVFTGGFFGSIMAFINGRYLLRSLVEIYSEKSPKFALIDNVVGMNGFKVTFLLRLSPVTPYNVFNYFMGLTSVRLKDYSCASVGMIPDTIVYCFIGGSIASIAKLSSVGFDSDPVLLIFTIVGSIAAIVGVIYISYIAKKEFNKMASESSISSIGINSVNGEENELDNMDIDAVVLSETALI